jgi:hypothetical protein
MQAIQAVSRRGTQPPALAGKQTMLPALRLSESTASARDAHDATQTAIQAALDDARTRKEALHRVMVEVLCPPAIFGELAILEPWDGFQQGTVQSYTYAEMLVLSKHHIDHRAFTKEKLEDLQARAVSYPKDEHVIGKALQDARWREYRQQVLWEVDKRRWPVDKRRI